MCKRLSANMMEMEPYADDIIYHGYSIHLLTYRAVSDNRRAPLLCRSNSAYYSDRSANTHRHMDRLLHTHRYTHTHRVKWSKGGVMEMMSPINYL